MYIQYSMNMQAKLSIISFTLGIVNYCKYLEWLLIIIMIVLMLLYDPDSFITQSILTY
jgi:hypothetical protein